MTRHTFTFLLCLSSLFLKPVVAEELTIDFTYERNVNIGSISPSLKLAPFADARGLADPNTIVGDDRAQLPLADLIRDAFEQGFNKGGVEFVDAAADMEIVGTLLSSELETVDRAGVPNLQLTIRAGIELRGGGRSIWSTTLFGRGRVPVKEGLSGAVKASFERLVRELLGTTISCWNCNNIGGLEAAAEHRIQRQFHIHSCRREKLNPLSASISSMSARKSQ